MSNTSGSIASFWTSIVDSYLRIQDDLWIAALETLYMVVASTGLSVVLGFLLATILITTGPHGLSPRPRTYRCLDFVINLFRSTPFIILIICMMPLTRLILGKGIGTHAALLPLTVAAIPFAARLIEGCFLEVDQGVVEAARSFGAERWQIILFVLLPEALPSIVLNIAILAIALLGYSAMAGVVGGGGLGDLAYQVGYNRFQTDVIAWSTIVLLAMVQLIQSLGNAIYKSLR